MILLRDAIEIGVPPDRVFGWLGRFQENYLAWHPDHVDCRLLKGTSLLEVGAVVCIEEHLHGKLHELKLRTTEVVAGSRVEYRGQFGIGGAFEVKPQGDGSLFIAEIAVGTGFPVVGWLVDAFMRGVLSRQLEGIRQHMVEEGKNLKRWLEEEEPDAARAPRPRDTRKSPGQVRPRRIS